MKKEDLKVGMPIFLRAVGNASRREGYDIIETTVSKVGNKFFETAEKWRGRFHIDTGQQDGKGYSSNYYSYITKKEIEDEKEFGMLSDKIRKSLGQYGRLSLSLEQLREIDKIINKEEK